MSPDEQAFYNAQKVSPLDDLPKLVYADWLDEHDQPEKAIRFRAGLVTPWSMFFLGYGYGDSDGYGYGDGDGYGNGYGYGYGNGYGNGNGDGYGNGYGNGNGDGDGDGYGYGYDDGDGDGYGYGYDDGDGYGQHPKGDKMPTLGRNEAMILPNGWVICGVPVEQTGPYDYKVQNAFVICRTGGTPWDDLFDGKGRNEATFRYWGEVTVSNPFLCREWKGELPPIPKDKR